MSLLSLIKNTEKPLYVCLENYGCINQGVQIYDTEEEATTWWKVFTDLEMPTTEEEAEAIGQDEDYGEARVFRVTWDPSKEEFESVDVLWEKTVHRKKCPDCGTMMDYSEPKDGESKFKPFYTCPGCGHTEASE